MADIVITGACGHLGSALIRALLARGDSLTLIDNFSTHKQCSLYGLKGNWKLIEASVHNVHKNVFYGRTVIHLAAIAEPQTSIDNPQLVVQHNTRATDHIVNSLPSHMVFASSAGVYGPQPGMVDESCTNFNPQTPYARAKLTEESLVKRLPSYTIFRMGTLFGPSPGMRFHTAVNKFCWQAATGQPITVWKGAYKENRPYLDVFDAAIVYKEATLSKEKRLAGIYNLVTQNATVEAVVAAIQEYVPRVEIEMIDGPKGMNQSSYEISSNIFMGASIQGGIDRTMGHLLG